MKVIFSLNFFLLTFSVFGQAKPDIVNYIKRYRHIAIDEMVRTNIPASITMAQGILESGCGKSPLSRDANNHFGIKCKTEWTGKKYYQDDDEAHECFRVYDHAEASYVDHSDFLLTRYRYATLFQLPPTDYKAWASGLKEVGYATNPKYASILNTYIETYKLHELDLIALAQIEEKEKLLLRSQSAEQVAAKAETKTVVEPALQSSAETNEVVGLTVGRQEFVINGIRAVKAVGSEDPFKIAFDYNIDYSFVMVFNDLNTGERFKDGEFIFLHAKKMSCETPTCIVKEGESMRDVSQRLGIKLKELYAKNLMKPNDQVFAGEVLNLNEKRETPPRIMSYAEYLKTQPKNDRIASTAEYRVLQTDTLYSIAKKFNTTVEQLKALNDLESTELQPGQTLVVAR